MNFALYKQILISDLNVLPADALSKSDLLFFSSKDSIALSSALRSGLTNILGDSLLLFLRMFKASVYLRSFTRTGLPRFSSLSIYFFKR